MDMVVDGKYNWKHQTERLVYIGKMGAWHRFALVSDPYKVWCEVLDEDLHMLEETVEDVPALTEEYRVVNADGNATPAYSLEYARGQQEK